MPITTKPSDLECFRTCDEYAYISQGVLIDALSQLFLRSPRVFPSDPLEALWKGGNCQSKEWLQAKVMQIIGQVT